MKCIKNTDEVIRRVRNVRAATQVASGDWVYIPKSEWKASRKAAEEKEAAEKKKTAKKKRAVEKKRTVEKKKTAKKRKAVEKRRAAETNEVNKLLRIMLGHLQQHPQTEPSRK